MILEELKEEIEKEDMLERERMASVIPHKPQVIPQNNFAFVHEGPLTQESINYSMDIEESCIDKLGFQV